MDQETLFSYLSQLDTTGKSREELESETYEKFGKNLAVLCMDSTGFSRTVKKRGIVYYLSLIAKMRTIVALAVEEFSALSHRGYADNFFAEFPTVTDAFCATLRANEQIRKAGLLLSDDELYQICSGIGYGHVLFSHREGPFGDQMNLASKLGEDTAEGEEILLTPEALKQLSSEFQSHFTKKTFAISGLQEEYYATTFEKVKHLLE